MIIIIIVFFLSSTLFVDIDGLLVSYGNYFNSFKARGAIGDEVMNSFIQVLNFESKRTFDIKPFIKKYYFTSYFTVSFLLTLFCSRFEHFIFYLSSIILIMCMLFVTR